MVKLFEGFEVEWKPLGDIFDLRNGYIHQVKQNRSIGLMVAFLGLEWKI